MTFAVMIVVGSLRQASWTRKLVQAMLPLAPQSLTFHLAEIGDLPLYNEDLEKDPPPEAWTRFRAEIAKADAVLFATPEYNRSIPACLKNALDVGSRPQGKNLWDGMPAAIISVSPYQLGAFGANHAMRQTLVFTNLPVMQQPEAYIGKVADLLDKDGKITNDGTKAFLTKFLAAFADWIATIRHQGSGSDFARFLQETREPAAQAYVRGDAAPLDKIVAPAGDASFFHPMGDTVTGAAEVKARYDQDAKAFGADGRSELDVLQAGSSQLAFWCGTQTADVQIGGKARHMTLRITEIFRRSAGKWLLVHRHADMPDKS